MILVKDTRVFYSMYQRDGVYDGYNFQTMSHLPNADIALMNHSFSMQQLEAAGDRDSYHLVLELHGNVPNSFMQADIDLVLVIFDQHGIGYRINRSPYFVVAAHVPMEMIGGVIRDEKFQAVNKRMISYSEWKVLPGEVVLPEN